MNIERRHIMLCFWIFPFLFLVDNILGFNGYQLTIRGISIRILLFCLSVISLCSLCLYIAIQRKLSLKLRGEKGNRIWDYIKPIDYIVAGFILWNVIWATIVPLLIRNEMTFALKDVSTILVLVLYFPCVFLIRTGYFQEKKFEKIAYILLVLLALWHVIMFVGETIAPGFYAGYYDFIDIISFGTAVRSSVVYGYGVVRIIQTTSLFLIPAMFMTIRFVNSKKWIGYLSGLLVVFSILITYTKSIWLGCLAGLLYVFVGALFFTKKQAAIKKRIIICVVMFLSSVFIFNYMCLDNTIFSRMFNSFSSDTASEQRQQELLERIKELESSEGVDEEIERINNELKDAAGTAEANNLRSQQKNALLSKWSESKLFGYGYGAYSEECIRNEVYPYMYEYAFPALLMKLGIVGLLGWIVFILALLIYAFRRAWKVNRISFILWVGCALAYAMAVQTNPFLFTFTGISILLYLCIKAEWSGIVEEV